MKLKIKEVEDIPTVRKDTFDENIQKLQDQIFGVRDTMKPYDSKFEDLFKKQNELSNSLIKNQQTLYKFKNDLKTEMKQEIDKKIEEIEIPVAQAQEGIDHIQEDLQEHEISEDTHDENQMEYQEDQQDYEANHQEYEGEHQDYEHNQQEFEENYAKDHKINESLTFGSYLNTKDEADQSPHSTSQDPPQLQNQKISENLKIAKNTKNLKITQKAQKAQNTQISLKSPKTYNFQPSPISKSQNPSPAPSPTPSIPLNSSPSHPDLQPSPHHPSKSPLKARSPIIPSKPSKSPQSISLNRRMTLSSHTSPKAPTLAIPIEKILSDLSKLTNTYSDLETRFKLVKFQVRENTKEIEFNRHKIFFMLKAGRYSTKKSFGSSKEKVPEGREQVGVKGNNSPWFSKQLSPSSTTENQDFFRAKTDDQSFLYKKV